MANLAVDLPTVVNEDKPLRPADATRSEDVGTELPSEAVVRAVAEVRDCDPLDLPPLNDAIDPDALDAVFADRNSGRPRDNRGRVVFEYGDCTVALLGPDELLVDADD